MGSSVVVFAYDPVKGSLTPLQTISTLPASFKGIDNSSEINMAGQDVSCTPPIAGMTASRSLPSIPTREH